MRTASKVQIHGSGSFGYFIDLWLVDIDQNGFPTLSQDETATPAQHYHLEVGFLVRVLLVVVLRDR